MPRGYHHLTGYQRCQLYTLKKRGDSNRFIAQEIGVHRSTIYREKQRNSGLKGYRYKQADEKAKSRRQNRRELKMTQSTLLTINEKLNLQWSPEQISGWMKKEKHAQAVSHESIYRYIWRDKREGGSLHKNLRHRGKKYNKRCSSTAGRGCIPGRVDISQRPAIVEQKRRLGDWELDTIIGKSHKGAIVSIVDRASKLTKLAVVPRKTAVFVEQAIVSKLGVYKAHVHTLTSDNGREFANHKGISKRLSANFYFSTPYHSWERGLNEHTNGLVRQYFPKTIRFDNLTQKEVEKVEVLLNNRPRKVLNFLTPIEAFEELRRECRNVALQN